MEPGPGPAHQIYTVFPSTWTGWRSPVRREYSFLDIDHANPRA
jgi:hypothetical protein